MGLNFWWNTSSPPYLPKISNFMKISSNNIVNFGFPHSSGLPTIAIKCNLMYLSTFLRIDVDGGHGGERMVFLATLDPSNTPPPPTYTYTYTFPSLPLRRKYPPAAPSFLTIALENQSVHPCLSAAKSRDVDLLNDSPAYVNKSEVIFLTIVAIENDHLHLADLFYQVSKSLRSRGIA
jgi:hypothetical protein